MSWPMLNKTNSKNEVRSWMAWWLHSATCYGKPIGVHSLAWERFRITLVCNWHDAEHTTNVTVHESHKISPVCIPLWVDHKMTWPLLNKTISKNDVRHISCVQLAWRRTYNLCATGMTQNMQQTLRSMKSRKISPVSVPLWVDHKMTWPYWIKLSAKMMSGYGCIALRVVGIHKNAFLGLRGVSHYYTNFWISKERLALV